MPDREALQARIRSLFRAELEEAIQSLNEGLVELSGVVTTERAVDLVRELFRVAHGIKGAAHSASVPDAVVAARHLEDALSSLRDDPTSVAVGDVSAMLGDVDALSAVLDELGDGRPREEHADHGVLSPGRPEPTMLRVDSAGLENLIGRTRELQLAAGTVQGFAESLSRHSPGTPDHSFDDVARQLGRLSAEVGDAALTLTLQPFAEACAGLPRAGLDLATAQGKRVKVLVEGGEVRVDRSVVAELREPLLHLLHNAVDHGIEPPTDRRFAGKPDEGTVIIRASLVKGWLEVTVSDDGRGVDVEALRVAAAPHTRDSRNGDLELSFVAGVSTARGVTDVSGRGVGLDAVRSKIERLGGSVILQSEAGRGASVTMRSPVTLSVLDVLVVTSGGETVCVPMAAVGRVHRLHRDDIHAVDGIPMVRHELGTMPLVSLASVSGIGRDQIDWAESVTVIELRSADRRLAAAVDEVVDVRSIVLEAVPTRLPERDLFLGVAVLESNAPALVLNAAALLRRNPRTASRSAVVEDTGTAPMRILLAEDTATTRALEASILEAAGYTVVAAPDGQAAWELLERDGADVVVSDVDMPRLNGIELCRRIRSSTQFAHLPVVLVTSLGSADDRLRGAEAGADAYLVKSSFDQSTLLDTVARFR